MFPSRFSWTVIFSTCCKFLSSLFVRVNSGCLIFINDQWEICFIFAFFDLFSKFTWYLFTFNDLKTNWWKVFLDYAFKCEPYFPGINEFYLVNFPALRQGKTMFHNTLKCLVELFPIYSLYLDEFSVTRITLLIPPDIRGVTLCFCTGSYTAVARAAVAAAGCRLLFTR